MSWIEDLHNSRVFNYKFTDRDELLSGTISELSEMTGMTVEGVPGEVLQFDGSTVEYAGFESVKVASMSLVSYEKNGRKAYKITDPSGKIRYISKSKHDYLKHGEIDGKKLKRRGSASLMKGEPE